MQDAGGDFKKLKLSNQNIFSAIVATRYDSTLFKEVVKEFPELLKPSAIDPIFFLESEKKFSRNISGAASFDPAKALEGNGLQVSITPDSVSKKKTIIIDHSFFNGKERKIKQIRRLIAEGFRVLTFDGEDNFTELKSNFDPSIFEKAKDFPFAQNSKKYYEILARDFALPNDQILLLDDVRSKELETLFYSPLYSEDLILEDFGFLEDREDRKAYDILIGKYDNIEKLPKDDLLYLMRVGAAKDLSKREITRLLAKEPKIKEEEILSIAACSNQKNVLELVLSRGFDLEKLDPELKFHFFLVALGNL